MGALTFDALLRSLKQGASDPVYYLHGDEDVLKDEAVRALVERAVDPAARDFNVDQRSARRRGRTWRRWSGCAGAKRSRIWSTPPSSGGRRTPRGWSRPCSNRRA